METYMKQKKILFLLFFVFTLWGCQSATGKESILKQEQPEYQKNEKFDTYFTGVLREYDTEKKSVTIYNITDKKNITFNYTGGTDIRDKYDQMITMEQIQQGEIVTVFYRSREQKLAAIEVSKDAWEYNKVKSLSIDKTAYQIKIASRNYWYEEGLLLFSEGKEIDLIDLNAKDEVAVKGVGSQICSIVVTTGHGYIRLQNYADFIGGTIEVGYGIMIPIVKNMLIAAKEGEYKVHLQNGELLADKTIYLKREEEIILDLSAYHMPKKRIGNVRFDIEPFGADLYINGTSVDYSEPISLNFGKHKIQVSMNGYEEFYGKLTIAESTQTISISLAEGTYEAIGESPEKEPIDSPLKEAPLEAPSIEETELEEEDVPGEKEQTLVDQEHTTTVESPAGASLYLNGKLKGTIPLTFGKECGSYTIVLSQAGYLTKSYSVEVIDDGENAVFNFPNMIPSQ